MKTQEIIKWIKTSKDKSDYMMNLKRIIDNGVAFKNNLPILVSAVPAYYKYLKSLEKQAVKKLSNYVGEIGDKIEVNIKIESIRSFETDYGMKSVYSMVDDGGNKFTWFTGSGIDKDVGDEIRIKATVKDHKEYREEKQTVILRVKEI